jgi:hypothetical protein
VIHATNDSSPTTSSNWAGYAVSAAQPTDGTSATPLSFGTVTGSWIQPRATCTASSPTYSAFWIGLGGFSEDSQALEQIGTEADCSSRNVAGYAVWYELVPASPVQLKVKVRPGDRITASVTVAGRLVSLRLRDATRKWTFTRKLTTTAIDVSSAEWIAEAPSTCDSSGRCRVLPLTNFGTVSFSSATATVNGHTGTINDPTWAATAIELDSSGDVRFAGMQPATQAVPAALSPDGGSFSITWQQTPQ